VASFSPTTYDPRADSSPQTEYFRSESGVDPGGNPVRLRGVIIDLTDPDAAHLKACACGCRGAVTRSSKSTFRMGHDARLRGILLRAHLTGTEVHVLSGGVTTTGPATAYAAMFNTDRRDWVAMLYDAEKAQGTRPARRPAPANRTPDPEPTPTPEPESKYDTRIKVGRWEYDAYREDDTFWYKNAQGEPRGVSAKRVQVLN
jgi:hypothetical protein